MEDAVKPGNQSPCISKRQEIGHREKELCGNQFCYVATYEVRFKAENPRVSLKGRRLLRLHNPVCVDKSTVDSDGGAPNCHSWKPGVSKFSEANTVDSVRASGHTHLEVACAGTRRLQQAFRDRPG
jgi:hypothetical protein